MKEPRPKLHYAWIVTALGFLVLIAVAGARSASSVLFLPLEHDLGWSAATISIAVAINVTLYGAFGPFAAAAMEALGIRRTMLAGLAVIALSALGGSFISTPLQLALTWGVGLGAGIGLIGMPVGAVIATRWFVSHRGLVLGLLTGASATGQLIFLPLLAWTVQAWGWRGVGYVVAIAAVAIAIPLALFMRDRPESVGLRAFGEPDNAPPRRALSSNPLLNAVGVLGRASHSRDFWIVAGTFFICGATTNGFIGTHFIALCSDAQIPQITSASLLAAIGVFSMIGSTASGMLSDRFASRWMLFTVYGLRGLSLFALPFALVGPASSIVLPVFVVFYGLDWLATGGPNLRALAEALGKEDAPVAFGWIGVFHQVGAGMTAFLAGAIRTELGTYGPAFAITGALCMIAALASLGIGWRGTPTRRLATA